MKKFRITEQQQVTATWFYTVEANSEEEAMEMVFKGEVEHDEYIVDNTDSEVSPVVASESYFDVMEVKD